MANINSLFNYGTAPEEGGWKVFTNDKFEDSVESSDIAGLNPNQAVPSPYARFEVARRAFENLAAGEGDIRDKRTVSNVFDVLEVLFDGTYRFSIERANISDISETLKNLGERTDKELHLKIYGEALRDYFARDSFMNSSDKRDGDTLYIFAKGLTPFAITSTTSIVLPTPDPEDSQWDSILVGGTYRVFSENKRLIDRNKNFVIYVYRLMKGIYEMNNGYPEAIKPMADYLTKEYEALHRSNPALFEEIKEIRNFTGQLDLSESYDFIGEGGNIIKIFGAPLCKIRTDMASGEVAKESELILKPVKNTVSGSPLVLTTNIPAGLKLKYTSSSNFWDRNDSKLDYSDEQLKMTEIGDRKTLPNGVPYPDGFIYDHDFLSDYIIRLPYKFTKEVFFNGNLDDDIEEGFIPPVTEKYFEYFTIQDLKNQMKINLKKAGSDVKGVEVLLSIPLTSGEKVTLRKVYTESDQEVGKYNQLVAGEARGMIVDLKAALTFFPNILFSEKKYNNYLFQLARDSFSHPEFEIELETFLESEPGNAMTLKQSIRKQEDGINAIVHYSLENTDFSYVKLNLIRKTQSNDDEEPVSMILIPNNFKYYEVGKQRAGLVFGFDFGTSNTHIAVMTNNTDDNKDLKFELPVDQCVSTIDRDALINDDTVSFIEYQSQLILPEGDQFGFPMPTVISKPKVEYNDVSDDMQIPFLHASIPFQYGKEDYGVTYNEIQRNLKWNVNIKDNRGTGHYAKAFINELVFLAQVFAVTKDASILNSEMVWSYPISMSRGLKNELKTCWERAFEKYFGGQDRVGVKVKTFTESMAPMVYYKATQGDDVLGTVVSIDIGGGTSDVVVTPDSKYEESKLASIGLGGDNLFAIEKAKVSEIQMLDLAIKQISDKIKAHKRNPGDTRFNKVLKDLENLKGANEADATNVLFGLPYNKALKDFKDDVDFNKWLISRPLVHPVFHYYYAAILYYLADMMKNNPDTFTWAPEKFLFSGAGSKILDIVGKGSQKILRQFTMDLFWFFLDGYEFPEETGDFDLKMERKEPKEITAKGCIIKEGDADKLRQKINELTGANKGSNERSVGDNEDGGTRRNLSFTRKKPTEQTGKVIMRYKMIPSIDNEGKTLTESDLSNREIQKEICESVNNFHEMYTQFIEGAIDNGLYYEEDDLQQFKNDFFGANIKTALMRQLKLQKLYEKSDSKDEYTDVPFFLVIKNLIRNSICPKNQDRD